MDQEVQINHSQYAQGVDDAIKSFEKYGDDIGGVIDEYDDSSSLSYTIGYLTTVQDIINKIIEKTQNEVITYNKEEIENEQGYGEDYRYGADTGAEE